MKGFPSYENPVLVNALICFYDITNFAQTGKAINDSIKLMQFMQGIARITDELISKNNGHIVKYIGDSALILFPEEYTDQGVNALMQLKSDLEAFIADQGMNNKVSFYMHFGEIAIGKLAPLESLDLIGDAANIAATLGRGGFYHGKFVMTPQVFRKLKPQTRKLVHKFTPPVVYILQ